jgi:endonuclease I
MKIVTITICLLCSILLQGQDYYKTAFNKGGDSLKSSLNQIIKNHTEFPYTSSSTDVWDILKETDRDENDSNNVILIYSGRSVNAAQEYNSGKGWSREHVWAKSRGDFGTDEGAGTDVHHLRPCDVSVNSTRNNRNFDDCITCKEVIDNGFNTGSKRDENLWTFEPPDDYKGDVARMIFYMTVRYEGDSLVADLELTDSLLGNTDKSPLQGVKTTLLKWHRNDKVSDWERNRNEIIYKDYQKNRNPFIDFPELAEYLYGDSIGYVWKPEIKLSVEVKNKSVFKVYPNPTKDSVTIEGDFTKLTVINSFGQVLNIEVGKNISLEGYPEGIYLFQIIDSEGGINLLKIKKEK